MPYAMTTVMAASMALAMSNAAFAQGAPADHGASSVPVQPAKPGLILSDPALAPGQSGPPVNRTSVEHSFGPQGVTMSAGYLCGLTPLSERTPGPASTFGPVGTFLGGKLIYAFK